MDVRTSAFGAVILAAVAGCTDARLQRAVGPEAPLLDNRVSIKGEFCTEPAASVSFPVKVLFLLDQSASLQCTDSRNERFGAVNRSLDALSRQPNTRFGFVGFSSWSREQTFTRDRGQIADFVDPAGGLGPATDYQGALATAARIIETDIQAAGPAERARTRYVLNFVSDGIPEPRCNAGCEDTISACSDGVDNDGDGAIDAADSDCDNIEDNTLHPDNLYGVCNTTEEVPDDVYVDMDGICPEYNQPTQIVGRVRDLMALADAYSVGSITLNTFLLFSPQEVVEGVCPGAAADFGYDKRLAAGLLQAMAEEGEGIYRDVNLAQTDEDFLEFGISSLEADQTLTSMMLHNVHARHGDASMPPADSDGDGLPDELEVELRLDRYDSDSDGDRYSDLFEYRLRHRGFDPGDSTVPPVRCENDRDSDGDGLLDCEEKYLGTDSLLPDTDGDGILDWHEFLHGTDPLVADARADDDFDGVLNFDEIRAGSDPLVPDEREFRDAHVTYELDHLGSRDFTPEPGLLETRQCYDFAVNDIRLTATPIPKQRGLNRLLLYTSERPAIVGGVPGEVRVACFEAIYNGGRIRQPASGLIDIRHDRLQEFRSELAGSIATLASCPWFGGGGAVDRALLTNMIDACMPAKVELAGRLHLRSELIETVERQFDGQNSPKLPSQGYELFVPIQTFDSQNDCLRLWEFDLLAELIDAAEAACHECSASVGGL